MRLEATPLGGAYVVRLEPIGDERGWFARTYDGAIFREHGLDPCDVQCSVSFNSRAGTLRGMHWQDEPHGEAKLVRCTRGAIYDAIIDMRPGSATYTDWFGLELTPENEASLYVPAGFAHGFQTLADATEVHYQMSHEFVPGAGRGVRWDDPAFGIAWPAAAGERIISERDATYPDFHP